MDNETFDQIHVPKETIGEGIALLKEGTNLKVFFDGDEPVFAELPVSVEMEVTYTEPGMKGDTATRTLKAATIETGAQIKVPLFISIGDKIRIDTRTGDYIERVSTLDRFQGHIPETFVILRHCLFTHTHAAESTIVEQVLHGDLFGQIRKKSNTIICAIIGCSISQR